MAITTVFQDTFTDTNGTLLRNHVADTGGAWKSPYYDATTFTDRDIVITDGVGGAAAESSIGIDGTRHYNLSVMPAADCEVTASFVVAGVPASWGFFHVMLDARMSATKALGAELYIDETTLTCYLGQTSGYNDYDQAMGNTYVASVGHTLTNGAHNVKMIVAGSVVSVYFDAILVHTLDMLTTTEAATYPTAAGYVAVGFDDDHYSGAHTLTLDSFTVTADTTEPFFWTGRVGCDEVIVA